MNDDIGMGKNPWEPCHVWIAQFFRPGPYGVPLKLTHHLGFHGPKAQKHQRIRHHRGSTRGFEMRKWRAWDLGCGDCKIWIGMGLKPSKTLGFSIFWDWKTYWISWINPYFGDLLGWTSINPKYFAVNRRVSRCWPADLECDWHRLWRCPRNRDPETFVVIDIALKSNHHKMSPNPLWTHEKKPVFCQFISSFFLEHPNPIWIDDFPI